jgi:hypothetical protein
MRSHGLGARLQCRGREFAKEAIRAPGEFGPGLELPPVFMLSAAVRWVNLAECRAGCPEPRSCVSSFLDHRLKLERAYAKLLDSTSRVVGQAKRFSKEIAEGIKRSANVVKQLGLEDLRQEIDAMVPRVKQVMKQTRARILRGDTRTEGKIFNLFEPSTEIIRKGKAGKPNEFGKM